jgi:hypothetical protein
MDRGSSKAGHCSRGTCKDKDSDSSNDNKDLDLHTRIHHNSSNMAASGNNNIDKDR